MEKEVGVNICLPRQIEFDIADYSVWVAFDFRQYCITIFVQNFKCFGIIQQPISFDYVFQLFLVMRNSLFDEFLRIKGKLPTAASNSGIGSLTFVKPDDKSALGGGKSKVSPGFTSKKSLTIMRGKLA
jgi:hypothetical protein